MLELSLKGKTALITGAAGVIGHSTARLFALAGSALVLADLPAREAELTALRDELVQTGADCRAVSADLTDPDQMRWISDERVDILVNNAGRNVIKPSLSLLESEWDEVLEINLKSVFFLTRQVVQQALTRGRGCSVINIASQHGVVGNSDRAAYCGSKGGLLTMSKALAVEWARHHVRINCISPSFVLSEQNERFLNLGENRKKYLSKIPLGRYATPEDVAQAAVFLASDFAAYITGANLLVDGGYTAQ